MYQQQRDAIANGDMRGWLYALAPDQMEEITIMRPNGDSVVLIAARIGCTQVGISPEVPGVRPSEIVIHTHDTEADAAACYADNVADAREQANQVNRVVSMPKGPERTRAAYGLLWEMSGEDVPEAVMPALSDLSQGPGVREVSTGQYL